MALTTSGALKAHVEGAGLGLAVFRRVPAPDARLPYVLVTDGVSVTPERGQRRARHRGVSEQAQVSLWQRIRADGPLPGEDYLLPDRLAEALDGARLASAPWAVFGVTLDQVVRVEEREENVVQHAMTVRVRRERVPR